ncbi:MULTISPECIES: hypothetical protein [unclassified Frankia]|uniref:hypothetical protein n=1 Tax=unclassified Frankia TaxID=2632575 RepID=UPI002023FE71
MLLVAAGFVFAGAVAYPFGGVPATLPAADDAAGGTGEPDLSPHRHAVGSRRAGGPRRATARTGVLSAPAIDREQPHLRRSPGLLGDEQLLEAGEVLGDDGPRADPVGAVAWSVR